MAGRQDIEKLGCNTRFSSANQPKKNGRKPKLYTLAKKGYDIGLSEFIEVSKYLMQCPQKELDQIAANEATPVWVVNIARAISKDTKRGVTFTVKDIFDRVFGKTAQNVDLTTKGEAFNHPPIDWSKLSDQTLRELAKAQMRDDE